MKVWMYKAALWCDECMRLTKWMIEKPAGYNLHDEHTWDSDDYPKGPYESDGIHADSPDHCYNCGRFLESRLTTEGNNYVLEAVTSGHGDASVLATWRDYYDYLFTANDNELGQWDELFSVSDEVRGDDH